MNKAIHLLAIIYFIIFFSSCLRIGTINFKGLESKLTASEKIKAFLKENKTPSILVRIPNQVQQITEGNSDNYLFSAIENELAIAGFEVRDRGIFNQIINGSPSSNYSEIKELTNTDLILEVVKMDMEVLHRTNKFLGKNGNERVVKDFEIEKIGAAFAFKIIIIKDNSYGGHYSFYYTPCSDSEKQKSCTCKIAYKIRGSDTRVYPKEDICEKEIEESGGGYEIIDIGRIELFIREAVINLIKEVN